MIKASSRDFRSPDDNVRIMAVTKTVSPEAINHAVELGIDSLTATSSAMFLELQKRQNSSLNGLALLPYTIFRQMVIALPVK